MFIFFLFSNPIIAILIVWPASTGFLGHPGASSAYRHGFPGTNLPKLTCSEARPSWEIRKIDGMESPDYLHFKRSDTQDAPDLSSGLGCSDCGSLSSKVPPPMFSFAQSAKYLKEGIKPILSASPRKKTSLQSWLIQIFRINVRTSPKSGPMSSKTSQAQASAIHPPIGTLIDGDSLELVEVLGVGGYGVVYRAVDARSPTGPKSYAVKCLVSSGHQTARQRQIHIREIALHQLSSAHPGVVTLHRVVEHFNHTYIIMDYAPDHDLFTQILYKCRYLADDAIIKDVFLQLLDAVEYCHNLGIYHRDLKPENILCFDDGFRVAITDFGLATTDRLSDEFRTGSVYHMSPECQGGVFAPTGKYSPMFNDIWSLGIILLNLATGRNPWKSATPDDPTFQAYLRDPYGFLPTVLPISAELNDILVQMLEVDWRRRMKLRDVRYAIEELTTFYSKGVIFEGSMARCPWEAGMDIDSDSSDKSQEAPSPVVSSPVQEPRLTSRWSKDSTSDIVFASRSSAEDSAYGVPWPEFSSSGATWAYESPLSSASSIDHFRMDTFEHSETSSEASSQSPVSSLPTTPNSVDMTFPNSSPNSPKSDPPLALTINTDLLKPRIYNANASMTSFSTNTSMMHTAIEYDPYSSLFFLSTPISPKLMVPDSAVTAVGEDKEMTSPTAWTPSVMEISPPSLYSDSSTASSSFDEDTQFSRSASPSPEPWSGYHITQVESPPSQRCQPSSSVSTSMTDVLPSPSRPSIFATKKSKPKPKSRTKNNKPINNKNGNSNSPRFTIKFFPRSPTSTSTPTPPTSSVSRGRTAGKPYSTFTRHQTAAAPSEQVELSTQVASSTSQSSSGSISTAEDHVGRKNATRHWFIPGRFFATSGVA